MFNMYDRHEGAARLYFDARLRTVLKKPWIILERLPSSYAPNNLPLLHHDPSIVPNIARLTGIDFRAWQAFALEETLLHQVHWLNGKGYPTVHIWQGGPSVILGHQDTRLPALERALYALLEQGFSFFVRPSGGRLVVQDDGVINISVILPDRSLRTVSLTETFLWMAHWLRRALHLLGYRTNIGEVNGSYCPGQYDVAIYDSIDQHEHQQENTPDVHTIKKVAGIAQRRIESGVLLVAFLNMHACEHARGEIAHLFYRLAGAETEVIRHTVSAATRSQLNIEPSKMTSLYVKPVDQNEKNFLRKNVISALIRALKDTGHDIMYHHFYNDVEAIHGISQRCVKDESIGRSDSEQCDEDEKGKKFQSYWHQSLVKVSQATQHLFHRLSLQPVLPRQL